MENIVNEKENRNNEIRSSIERSKKPVLPFELILAEIALKTHFDNQRALGALMREAMSQSSETWHDNAPAEVVRDDSKKLAKAAERTKSVVNNAEVFSYDADPTDGVTLGSIINIQYKNEESASYLFLTGVSHELTPEISDKINALEDVTVVTLESPIGKAILGKSSGDEVIFSAPNGREISLTIESIQQIKP